MDISRSTEAMKTGRSTEAMKNPNRQRSKFVGRPALRKLEVDQRSEIPKEPSLGFEHRFLWAGFCWWWGRGPWAFLKAARVNFIFWWAGRAANGK